MPTLVLADVKISDAAAYIGHVCRSGPAVTAFGARPVVRRALPGRPQGADDGPET
jgi:uncharacterized protein (DUF1330 family)